MSLSQDLSCALERRQELFERLHAEKTTCYRLFHGSNEGQPGLTIDRYGPQLLIQSFHQSLASADVHEIERLCSGHFEIKELVYNDRSARNSRRADDQQQSGQTHLGLESGHAFLVKGKHQGQDPWLFLDFRVARKWLQAHAQACHVLNFFAYTCSMGVYAAPGKALSVTHVDFARRNLAVGRKNHGLNPSDTPWQMLEQDYFVVARQLAGLGIKQRRNQQQRTYPQFAPRQYERVILDPPRWAKSAFGTVDLVRDYASVLKPAILCTLPGGQLLCTNNVAKVPLQDWLQSLQRCAAKLQRPLQDLQVLTPEADFPSLDGQPPLKIAILSF